MSILSGQTYCCNLWGHVNERELEKLLLACGKHSIITEKFTYEEFERLMYVQFTSCVYMILGDRHYAVSNRYPCKPLQALKTLLYVYFVDTLWFAKSVTFCTSVRFCSADFVLIIINKYCRIFDSIEIKGTFVGNQWFIYVSFDRFSFD